MPSRRSRARLVGVVAVVLALAAATGCAQSDKATWRGAGTGMPSGEAGGAGTKKAPGEFKITPAADATQVSVLDPIKVTAQDATLEAVTVTNPDGKQVGGELGADRKSWSSGEPLGYGKQYKVTATGTNSAGQHIEQTSAFTTLKPKNQTQPYLRASDTHLLKERDTYGVGQTIQVWFDEPVPDKATAQTSLKVTTSPQAEGAWHWFGAQRVEWRPKEYWKPGTKVSVSTDVYGKDLGDGLYGQSDVSASFAIGQSRIAIADNNTKQMQVYVDGQVVRTMPVSLGKGGYNKTADGQTINYWTNGGPHVVLDKAPVTRMTSASYGVKDPKDPNYYDEKITLTVRISNAGEYVHMADWNIPAHGRQNTSHGCINVAPAHAKWFYDTFIPGDVVDVKNSPITLKPTDGIGAWTLSWNDWTKGSAL
ncbi:L,D-transpeptidase [Planosporangium flavigriseum]|nr:Ig-like domain-containing protein [Planosporangium flavigriseum]NJC63371.1 L,D-transpeptidase [Planosporangium flavigriseum]